MPDTRKVPPSYCLHRASGRARITLPGGKQVYLGPYGSPESRRRYVEVLSELEGDLQAAACPKPSGPTIDQLLLAYLEFAEGYYRQEDGSTRRGEIYNIERGIEPLQRLFGATPVRDFGPLRLEKVRDDLVEAGLARSTVNRYVSLIRKIFGWGVSKEMVPTDTWTALRSVQGLRKGRTTARETVPVGPVADAAVDAIRPFVSRQVWAMVELGRLTGMRPGEVCVMRAIDLDMRGPLWTYKPASHKCAWRGMDRQIFLGPRAQEVVKPFLTSSTTAFLFSPADAERERRDTRHAARKTPLSCGNVPGSNRREQPRRKPADHYSTQSFERAIQRACDNAFPVPQGADVRAWRKAHRWSPNQLRHSYATAIRARYGVDAAGTLLGHRELQTTAIYAEADLKRAGEIALQVG